MGGQLGSTLLLWHCIAAPQEYLTRTFIVPIGTTRVWRFGGHRNFGVPPHFGRGRYVPFSGIKKVLWQKTSKQNPESSRREISETKTQNRLWLWVTLNSNLSHKSTKTQKRLRLWVTQLESAAKQRATLNHKDTHDVTLNEHSRVD